MSGSSDDESPCKKVDSSADQPKSESSFKKDERLSQTKSSLSPVKKVKENKYEQKAQHIDDQLAKLHKVKGSSVWLEISCEKASEKQLKEMMAEIRNQKLDNSSILSIYNSRDKDLAYDVKVHTDLADRWIQEKFNSKHLTVSVLEANSTTKYVPKNPSYKPKYQQKIPAASLIKAPAASHIKAPQIQEVKADKKSTFRFILEYVTKDSLIVKIEEKVNKQLETRKQEHEKKKAKKAKKSKKTGPSIYSKNPFDDLDLYE